MGRSAAGYPGRPAALLDVSAQGLGEFRQLLPVGAGEVGLFLRVVPEVVQLQRAVGIVLEEFPFTADEGTRRPSP